QVVAGTDPRPARPMSRVLDTPARRLHPPCQASLTCGSHASGHLRRPALLRATALRVNCRMLTAGLAVVFGVAGVTGLLLPLLLAGMREGSAIVLCVGAVLLGAIAATNRAPMGTSIAPPGITRRYLRELLATMAAYALVLAF